jgi:type II secretory pathway pseudopilin PulG
MIRAASRTMLHCDERGQSLVEELIALAILALSVGILLTSIYTGTAGVKAKHRQVSAEMLARSQLELIQDAPYSADPISAQYPAVAAEPGYTVNVNIEYWRASSETFISSLWDDGMQKITVSVSGSEGAILDMTCYKVDR